MRMNLGAAGSFEYHLLSKLGNVSINKIISTESLLDTLTTGKKKKQNKNHSASFAIG